RALLLAIGPDIAVEHKIELLRAPRRYFGPHHPVAEQAAAQHTHHAHPARQIEPEDRIGAHAAQLSRAAARIVAVNHPGGLFGLARHGGDERVPIGLAPARLPEDPVDRHEWQAALIGELAPERRLARSRATHHEDALHRAQARAARAAFNRAKSSPA